MGSGVGGDAGCGTRERREGRGFVGDPRPAGRTSRSLLWVEGSRTGLGASRTKPLPRPVLGWESPGGGSVGPTVNPEALAPAPRCPLARVLVAGPLMEGARARAASSKPAARSRGTRPCAHVCGTAPPRRTRATHTRKVSRRTTATTAAGSRATWPARLEQQSVPRFGYYYAFLDETRLGNTIRTSVFSAGLPGPSLPCFIESYEEEGAALSRHTSRPHPPRTGAASRGTEACPCLR